MLKRFTIPKKKLLYALLLLGNPGFAQRDFKGLEHLFMLPKSYVVQHTTEELKIDGALDDNAWQKAAWTTDFVDIEGALKPLPTYRTQVKMLWNDSTLFIAAKMHEPQVWATQTNHDDIIFKDNDFEVFIDPDNNTHQYYELEINAINKIFDLFLSKPYRNGSDALIGWDVAGLKTAVQVQGTINNPADTDEGWTAEIAIPLKALRIGFPFIKPQEGSLWRINFSRVEWHTKASGSKNIKLKATDGRDLPEENWVWSPQGVINMHYPERWGYLQFTRKQDAVFKLPYAEQQKRWLWLVYYRQKQYQQKHNRYAATLTELGINSSPLIDSIKNKLTLESTSRQFMADIKAEGHPAITINDEGLIVTKSKTP
ncbi:carbohydrate-binding family 9-like protein [Mucilaginibacter sp. Bleaf8]|uniref:carbohydrate-binding family 9-like protein n=1 Tax=Mucilaginibacter sp. Bleaf8 TaxID=2834430 RepID=UPI001BCDADB8|nr:carbohydrate-binding family 9-like protein [Mucilaginibacter sp. Bleaf8]MBS7564871.1 carbohydrate-binding family 9-like protein [Mucilaginibacter sp. Bleaf8]